MKTLLRMLVLAFFGLLTPASVADSITIGYMYVNNFEGEFTFLTVDNFTSNVVFDNVQVTLNGVETINLGNIGPGSVKTFSLPFYFSSLLFTTTLSTTTLQLGGGTITLDPTVSVLWIPSGPYSEYDPIDDSTRAPAVAPEPSTLSLSILGLAGFGFYKRKQLRKAFA